MDRPILFSAPMVRALLAGTKTQTRRIVKHEHVNGECPCADMFAFDAERGEWEMGECHQGPTAHVGWLKCPYGAPSDRLWVRETWAHFTSFPGDAPGHYEVEFSGLIPKKPSKNIAFRADDGWDEGDGYGPWKPAIHMPRWASRLSLEVTGLRVERLQNISGADAIAEGLTRCGDGGWHAGDEASCWTDPRDAYRSLWESINDTGSWVLNPWVWVVAFKAVK